MFWPLMAADGAARRVPHAGRWWGGVMLLTNVFMIPFLALRAAAGANLAAGLPPPAGSAAAAEGEREGEAEMAAGRWPAAAFGALGGAVGAFSLAWALAGRPEYGGLPERLGYLQAALSGNRVFYAFVVDAGLYALWQAVLMPAAAPARYRYVPFFGLAAYLLAPPPAAAEAASAER